MRFKGVFDWNPRPAERYGKWILRAERHGGRGVHSGYPGLPGALLMKQEAI